MKNIILAITMLLTCFLVKAQIIIEGDCQNGFGTYENYESIYKGEWKDGMKDGKGIYTHKKANSEYVGDWSKGQKNGEGAEIDYMGVCYIGHWENNERKGEGILLYKNGYYKKGIFPDNLKYYTNENVEIAENEFTKITDLEILNRTGYGCVTGDCKNGTGTYSWYVWGIKCTYTGQWKNGKYDGEGTLTQDNGLTYTGHWKNNMKDGQGTEINDYYIGEKYEGKWVKGSHDGKGILTKRNGYYMKKGFKSFANSNNQYYTNENIEIKKEEFEKKTYPNLACREGNCSKGLGVCEVQIYSPEVNDIIYHVGYWNDRKKEGFGIDYTKTNFKQYGLWKNDSLFKTLTQKEAEKYLDADPIISDQIMYVYYAIEKTARDEKMDELRHKIRMDDLARKKAKRDAKNAEWEALNKVLQMMSSNTNTNNTTTSSKPSEYTLKTITTTKSGNELIDFKTIHQ